MKTVLVVIGRHYFGALAEDIEGCGLQVKRNIESIWLWKVLLQTLWHCLPPDHVRNDRLVFQLLVFELYKELLHELVKRLIFTPLV
jgi:hypothetical protein